MEDRPAPIGRARAQHRIRHITSIRIHGLNVLARPLGGAGAKAGERGQRGVEGPVVASPTTAQHPAPPGRSRGISTGSISTLALVSESAEAGSGSPSTIREEETEWPAAPAAPPASPRMPVRPGMNITRSRSRLVVPRQSSNASQSMGTSTSPQVYTLHSPTSPIAATSHLPGEDPSRRRSTSISSVQSGVAALHLALPVPPEVAHRRERAATISSGVQPVVEQERREVLRQRLVRCFVTLSVVASEVPGDGAGGGQEGNVVERPQRPNGMVRSASASALGTGGRARKSSAPTTMATPQSAAAPPPASASGTNGRPVLPRGRSGLGMQRTPSSRSSTSLTNGTTPASASISSRSTSPPSPAPATRSLGRTASARARPGLPSEPIKHRSEPRVPSVRPSTASMRKRLSLVEGGPVAMPSPVEKAGGVAFPGTAATPDATPIPQPSSPEPRVPFFVSHIHRPSIHPSFPALEKRSDFADWLTVEEAAGEEVELDVWVERQAQADALRDESGNKAWDRLRHRPVRVNLGRLRELKEADKPLPDNNILVFTFANTGGIPYFLPLDIAADDETQNGTPAGGSGQTPLATAMQRSLTETKMRRGVDLHVLHQVVHLDSVVRETARDLDTISARLDRAVKLDTSRQIWRRELAERQSRIDSQDAAVRDAQGRCTELRDELARRRAAAVKRKASLAVAEQVLQTVKDEVQVVEEAIATERSRRVSLLPKILAHRARSSQILDYIFPISPLDPQTLLYAILSVPLPIPQVPEMTAPPISLPSGLLPKGVKVDEDSTATALGFVAIVVQALSGILDHQLVYPVTCAGSRSLVRDPISIINGPRSFPLYSKGVERYRYEYAVFLLNKNIELMMVDARIRIEDIRHTLPNLKTLLLTVSADVAAGGSQLKKRTSSMFRPASPFLSPVSRASKRATDSPLSSSRTAVNSPTSTISQAAAKLHYIMGDS